MRVIITAGFDRAANALILCELLRRRGDKVAGVLVVSAFNIRRLQKLVRQHGIAILAQSARRLLGLDHKTSRPENPIGSLFSRYKITHRSLKKWCRTHNVDYITLRNINEPNAVEFVRSHRPDAVVYGGGGILRTAFIEAAGRHVLNAHSGPLPAIRGMNACEWSLFLNHAPAVTIHYINEGIDTGDVLQILPVKVEPGDDIDRLRDKCVAIGIEGLLDVLASLDKIEQKQQENTGIHRQCYVMAPAIREILEAKLAAGHIRPTERNLI